MAVIDALGERSWDYVIIHENAIDGGLQESYTNGNIATLVSCVKEHVPNAKLAWHIRHAYGSKYASSSFTSNFGADQMKMYQANAVMAETMIVPNKSFDVIIPTGTAIQNARSSKLGDTLCRDDSHLSVDLGRYIASLAVVRALTGLSIDDIAYTPAPGAAYTAGKSNGYVVRQITDEEKSIAIESVNNAMANPFAVTQSAYAGKTGEETGGESGGAEVETVTGVYFMKGMDGGTASLIGTNGKLKAMGVSSALTQNKCYYIKEDGSLSALKGSTSSEDMDVAYPNFTVDTGIADGVLRVLNTGGKSKSYAMADDYQIWDCTGEGNAVPGTLAAGDTVTIVRTRSAAGASDWKIHTIFISAKA